MPRLILIEPSIIQLGGHYYEYALRVLDEAGRQGFDPILAANRRARRLESTSWRTLPAYRYGFFEPGPPRAFRWARHVAARALRRADPPRAASTSRAGAGRPALYIRRKRRAFFDDSARFFQAVPLNAGDLVFLPTVAEADMLGLADLFHADPNTTKATWHLLFRRDVPQDEAGSERLRRHFGHFMSRLGGHQVSFYTDTEPLTARYNRLGAAVFRTLPIPMQDAQNRILSAEKLGVRGRPYHVVYLGDARTEKGYHWLPGLVTDSKAAGLPIRFTFQSNFNVPGGEPAAARARAQLASLPGDFGVTLLTEPLSSDAYFTLLHSADVVVIPYDAAAYSARSSGVFAEALGAGKPVIVPEGTWMAEELRRLGGRSGLIYRDPADLAAQLRHLLSRYDDYRQSAMACSGAWSAYHSAESLLKGLAGENSASRKTMPAAR